MAFVLFFLLFKGNSEAVGYFAAVTTIVAPLVMFCQYRYLEFLSLAEQNKFSAFSTALYASLMSYITLGTLLFVFAGFFEIDIKLLALMLLYKLFELFSDIYIAYLSIIKQMKKALLVLIM